NVYRLESSARGIINVAQAPKQTMRRAAELTLAKGYTHFVLADAGMRSGSRLASVIPGTATTSGRFVGDRGFAATTSFSPGVPIYAPTSNIGMTVVMYRANEPGARNALDAREVLAGL